MMAAKPTMWSQLRRLPPARSCPASSALTSASRKSMAKMIVGGCVAGRRSGWSQYRTWCSAPGAAARPHLEARPADAIATAWVQISACNVATRPRASGVAATPESGRYTASRAATYCWKCARSGGWAAVGDKSAAGRPSNVVRLLADQLLPGVKSCRRAREGNTTWKVSCNALNL